MLAVQLALTAIPIFSAWSVLAAALFHQRWWALWLAFVAGLVACIAVRSSLHARGFDLAIGILVGPAFIVAALSAGIAAYVISRYPIGRRNAPHE